MGVPYHDAWGMPADMALDMLGLSPNIAKSKQSNDKTPPPSLVQNTPPGVTNAPRKQVAMRRKSKLNQPSS